MRATTLRSVHRAPTGKAHAVAGLRERRPTQGLQRTLGNEGVGNVLAHVMPAHAIKAAAQDSATLQGQRLDPEVRADMEARLGHDFGGVRIHVGMNAADSAAAVAAKAYTIGTDIVFGAGQYAPETVAGRQLLAHELAHVVQQSRGGLSPGWQGDAALEAGAEQAAAAAVEGSGPVEVAGASGVGLARQLNRLNPQGLYPHRVTFKNWDEYVKSSAGTMVDVNDDGTVTAIEWKPYPESALAPAKPAPPAASPPKPKPKPKPKQEQPVDVHLLRDVVEATQPRLIYPKAVVRLMGVGQTIGGGLELAGAALSAESGVGPLLLGAHGIDTLQTGLRTIWSGEQERSGLFYAGSGAVFLFSDDPKLASAGGMFADMAGGVGAGLYGLHTLPSPTITLSPEAELDLELAQLANLSERPRFPVQFDPKWQDIAEGVLTPEGYKLNPKLQDLNSLLTPSGKIGGSRFGGVYMYVIDEQGVVHIGTRAGSHMPHPTLIGGPEPVVLGAGEIDIRAGQIYSINNLSGHFQPSPISLGAMYQAFSGLPSTAFKPNFLGFRVFYF